MKYQASDKFRRTYRIYHMLCILQIYQNEFSDVLWLELQAWENGNWKSGSALQAQIAIFNTQDQCNRAGWRPG